MGLRSRWDVSPPDGLWPHASVCVHTHVCMHVRVYVCACVYRRKEAQRSWNQKLVCEIRSGTINVTLWGRGDSILNKSGQNEGFLLSGTDLLIQGKSL